MKKLPAVAAVEPGAAVHCWTTGILATPAADGTGGLRACNNNNNHRYYYYYNHYYHYYYNYYTMVADGNVSLQACNTYQVRQNKVAPLKFFAVFSATVWNFNFKLLTFIYCNVLHLTAN